MRFAEALCLVALSCTALLPHAATAGQATVEKNRITSTGFPAGTIDVDPAFQYIGTKSFVLYDVADCEIHFFAELDGKQVKRFYWFQFEGYLPSKTNTYNYGKDLRYAQLGGHPFIERVWFRNVEEPRRNLRAGSDVEAVLNLLDEHGLRLPPDVMQVRLVRLDDAKRKELMIIYSESLAPLNLSAAALSEGGREEGQRMAIAEGLRARAIAGLKMAMP